jgi:hypothetical protein
MSAKFVTCSRHTSNEASFSGEVQRNTPVGRPPFSLLYC